MVIAKVQHIQNNIIDDYAWLVNDILGETLQQISTYLINRKISFGDILEFLRHPKGYPGKAIIGPKLIAERFINLTISKFRKQIQSANLPLKLMYQIIFKIIFKEVVN